MPVVLMTLVVGIVVGYWLCRMQLRGKFLIAEEMRPLPQSWCPPEESPLPPTRSIYTQSLSPPPRPPTDKNCPHGFSAKQVIGYNDFGYRHPAQYPGGIRAWNANVNGILHEEDEENEE